MRALAAMIVHKEESDYVERRQEAAEAEADRRRLAAGIDARLWELFHVESHATQRACGRLLEEEVAAGLAPTGAFTHHYPECLLEATDELVAAYRARSADGGLALGCLFQRWWPTPPTGKWPDRLPQPPPPPRELPGRTPW
jgi:hypothetical protein